MLTTIAIVLGVLLDFLLGDPYSWPHPVRFIGSLIGALEKWIRRVFPGTEAGLRLGGMLLWILVVAVSALIPAGILLLAWQLHPLLYVLTAAVMSYQIMATRCLRDEGRKVYDALSEGDLEKARYQVSMIVGRDTDRLSAEGVAKAAVETVAENTSDGSIAPLFYLALGGPVAGFFYKAVNTMDSMVGYKNETYRYLGWFAARADDVANFIPSRLAALLMIAAAALGGLDAGCAWRVYRRDRLKSSSPNAAQTESVCAGALHVELLGDAVYSGVLYHKEVLGDGERSVEPEDILRANRLLYLTVAEAVFCVAAVRFWVCIL